MRNLLERLSSRLLVSLRLASLRSCLAAEAKAARKAFKRDQVFSVLIDAVTYSQNLQRKVYAWSDEYAITKAEKLDGVSLDGLTAKLRLAVSSEAFAAWDAMRDGWDSLEYDVNLNGPRSGDPNGPAFDLNDDDVSALLKRIEEFLAQAEKESKKL